MNYFFLSREPRPKRRQRWCSWARCRHGGHVPILHPGLVWVQRAGGTGERWWLGVVQPEWMRGGTCKVGVAQPAQRQTCGWTGAGTVPPVPTKWRHRGWGRVPPPLRYKKGGATDPSDRACLPITAPPPHACSLCIAPLVACPCREGGVCMTSRMCPACPTLACPTFHMPPCACRPACGTMHAWHTKGGAHRAVHAGRTWGHMHTQCRRGIASLGCPPPPFACCCMGMEAEGWGHSCVDPVYPRTQKEGVPRHLHARSHPRGPTYCPHSRG